MIHTTLGRTGLDVSVAGLGGGGFSRLGLMAGKSETEVIALIRLALDLGVNFIDTAASYGTEEVIGKALASVPRDRFILATKAHSDDKVNRVSPADIVASLDNSLRLLKTDHIDLFQLHLVSPQHYEHAINEVAPALLRERDKGKLRFLGVTERSPHDPDHKMLQMAVKDDVWDSVMLGFNITHQSARQVVFPETMARKIATLLIFVVRKIFADPALLRETIQDLAKSGEVPEWLGKERDPLGFLIHEGGADNITDAAYRYARDEPGANVVLFGTGSKEHLRENIASLNKPPLPESDRARLAELFGHLTRVGLDSYAR